MLLVLTESCWQPLKNERGLVNFMTNECLDHQIFFGPIKYFSSTRNCEDDVTLWSICAGMSQNLPA